MRLVPLDAIHLHGSHLVDDVMAAVTVGAIANAAPAAMTAAVDAFRGLEHAMEDVGELDGVRFVNDSKATNVESALRSIESFDRDLGRHRRRTVQGRRSAAAPRPLRARAKAVVAIGEAKDLVRDAVSGAVQVEEARTLAEAVDRAFALARPSGVVLLAPGVRELRHVQGLRGTRPRVQGGSRSPEGSRSSARKEREGFSRARR